ncbi:MAG TPA: BatA domain-containing protein [Planctomycetaceae bacterium]|nr:BatA domain-containing protein [Planctomycetaceae bacterium]
MFESLTSSLTSLFVHPGFVLPGVALIAAPIIIHFINRLRFRRVKWAAMEFLLASQQRNRRRLLIEQLLLLLLRILVVAALVALVARPLVDPEKFSLFQGQKTHHLVLLDDSGSMRDRLDEATAFGAGLDVIRKIAAEGERKPDTQTITLLILSNPAQPLYTEENLNKEFVGRLESGLKGLKCSHRALDLAAGAEAARKLLAELGGAARNFHLVSDFRQQDWENNSALAAALREMDRDKITVNLIKTVAESHANLGITDLSGSVDVAAVNVPLRLSVTVMNYGDQVARDVRLTVLVDGQKRPATEMIEQIEPGKERTIEFDEQFPKTGPHDVQVALPADALEQDNVRFLSIQVPDTNPVLVVDGGSDESEAFYLIDALGAVPEKTGFSPTLDRPDSLKRRPLDKFQSIFLLNVSELAPDAIKALEDYVRDGGGLGWYLGPQVRAAFYNDKLYKDGEGLFPAKLAGTADLFADETNPAPDIAVTNHPVLDVFRGAGSELLNYTKVTRYFAVAKDWKAPDGVRVIASLRNKAPLFLEHRFGRGRVVTCLTACGTAWTNWPRVPDAFVPIQLQMATELAQGHRTIHLKTVGEPLLISLDAALYSPQVEVHPPDGSRVPLTVGIRSGDAKDTTPAPGDRGAGEAERLTYEEPYKNTDEPGVYALVLKRQDSGEEARRYAYNVAEAESRLKLISSETIKRRLGPDVKVQIQEVGDFNWVHGEESTREIHDYVLMLLLVILLAEQAMALKLSYHPTLPGARA